jgi:glycosyltransferase involved in cell wall biosynthesis
MTLSITINGRFLTRPSTGVERFAAELLRAWWPRYRAGRSAELALPAPDGDGAAARERIAELSLDMARHFDPDLRGHVWEQLRLPALSRDRVLINLCNSAPVTKRRQLVVLHDAAVISMPGSYGFAYRQGHRWLMRQLLTHAEVIVTVSQFSASELMRCFGRRRATIEVIHPGTEHILREGADTTVLARLGLRDRPFILAVGSRSPTKNLQAALAAAAELQDLRIPLVAAGGGNQRVFRSTGKAQAGLLSTGYVSNAELRALYEAATCFVFPSFYEGFGIPPLEAMHCGCPVVVSRRASLPEACGDAALYAEPDDPSDIARQLRRLIESPALRAEMSAAGLVHAKKFSWAAAAERFESVFARNFELAA